MDQLRVLKVFRQEQRNKKIPGFTRTFCFPSALLCGLVEKKHSEKVTHNGPNVAELVVLRWGGANKGIMTE